MTMTRNSNRDMTPRAKREGGLAGIPIMPPAAQTKDDDAEEEAATLTPDNVSGTKHPVSRPAREIKK